MQPTSMPSAKRSKKSSKKSAARKAEADRELKAYIYQQLAELQPYLVADSQLAVSVQQVLSSKENEGLEPEEPALQPGDYLVQLTTTIDDGKLVAEGHGGTVYEAFRLAKGGMVDQLAQLQNAVVDQTDRDEEVESYLSGSRTLH